MKVVNLILDFAATHTNGLYEKYTRSPEGSSSATVLAAAEHLKAEICPPGFNQLLINRLEADRDEVCKGSRGLRSDLESSRYSP